MARRICYVGWFLYTSQLLKQVLVKNSISIKLSKKLSSVQEFEADTMLNYLHQTESFRVHLSSLGSHAKIAPTIKVQERRTPSRKVTNGFERQKIRRVFLLET